MDDKISHMSPIIAKEFEVSEESYYLLKYSSNFHFEAQSNNVKTSFFIDRTKYFIKLEGEAEILTKFYFRSSLSMPDLEIVIIEIEDEDLDLMLSLNDNSTINPPLPNHFTKIFSNFAFIPKDEVLLENYKGKNILLFEVKSVLEKLLKSEYLKNLTDLKKLENIKSVFYKPKPLETHISSWKELIKYIELGKEIRKSKESEDFMKLIDDITFKKYNSCNDTEKEFRRHLPFVFVCASSGTGKTQLPFSLEIPMIYLINNRNIFLESEKSKPQEIYENFESISIAFKRCCELDAQCIANYAKLEDGYWKVFEGSYVADFFLTIFQEIIEIRLKNKDARLEHWTKSQLKIQKVIRFKQMPVYETRDKIFLLFKEYYKKINENFEKLPCVFLDELQKSEEKDFEIEYKLVRKLIRFLGLIPVFMGTNVSLVNFVDLSGASGSRCEDSVWSHVVYKLPEVNPKYLNSSISDIINLIDEKEAEEISKTKAKKFVIKVSQLIKKERPIFCNLFFEYLKCNFEKLFNQNIKVYDILEEILYNLFDSFTRKKRIFDISKESNGKLKNYNYCNLNLTAPEYAKDFKFYNGNNDGETTVEPMDIDKTSGIHNHIAYLYAYPGWVINQNDNSKRIFFDVVLGHNELNVLPTCEIKEKTPDIFLNEQIFAKFKHEPLGQLSFISNKSFNMIFLGVDYSSNTLSSLKLCRISCHKAISQINSNNRNFTSNVINTTSRWTKLELKAAVAALVASQENGFTGNIAIKWLRNFIRELDYSADFSKKLPNLHIIENNKKLETLLNNLVVPFCTPTLKAEWDEDFGKYLTENGANLGVTYTDLGNESRDFYIKKFFCDDLESNIISGECKFSDNGVSMKEIKTAINQLSNFKTLLNIIVINRLISNFNFNPRDFNLPCIIYKVVRQESDYNINQIYQYMNYNSNNQDLKLFIIIEID